MSETLTDLEGDICDLDEMSDLATHYVEEIIGSLLSQQRKGESVGLTPQEGKLILFCIYDLDRRTSALRERFFKLADFQH